MVEPERPSRRYVVLNWVRRVVTGVLIFIGATGLDDNLFLGLLFIGAGILIWTVFWTIFHEDVLKDEARRQYEAAEADKPVKGITEAEDTANFKHFLKWVVPAIILVIIIGLVLRALIL